MLGFCIRRDASELCPTPIFRYLKGQFIVNTALHTVQLLIMRIIPSENDGFVLVLFDFAFLDEPLFLCPDTRQQNAGGFVVWVLWDEFALDGFLEDGFFEGF